MEKRILNKFLKDKGLRLTKAREAVFQRTFSYQGHFNPESLYLRLKETGIKVSRASVYRTLSLLCECGLIEKVRKTEEGTLYEYIFGHEHHDHMHCLSCGEIIEFYSEDIERIQEELCKELHFKGINHSLEIRGYCKKCQKKKN
ncbi:MAG: transcriptional repressor [Nitrospirae bacterium]|nr:transcriptional repressor [Nitrospirota bacterium]